MPRPGPRPYECVRRAWHSDRHQPIRGSLIQEVFRVVNEIHSSATRKNKEWQEKLPVVVFKAEEIMYSKANSEAEYGDLSTVRERVNDAINTIIRRDESTETGDLLQPCIEAALNLGCAVRRASRSQRHNNPKFYLSPNTQEPTSMPPRIPDNATHKGSPQLPPLHSGNQTTSPRFMSHYSTLTRPTTMNFSHLGSGSCSPVIQDNPMTSYELPFSSEGYPQSGNNQLVPMETPMSNLGCVYPLYYGSCFQAEEPNFSFQIPQNSNSNRVVVGTPFVQSIPEPAEMGFLQNLFPFDGSLNASNRLSQVELRDTSENPPETGCDLSLRLGPLSAPCISAESSWTREVEDVGSSSSREGSKFQDLSPGKDKGFSFFPRDNAEDPLESCSSKWSSAGEGLNMEATVRKRKAPVSNSAEDGRFCLQPNRPSGQFFGRMRKPGP
ncbi:hypothetical protein HHK36_013923 [Tetracentron sinense]|uniref:Uncharacterized protein n=1 Tax=Tetracentron sinense TaxID=13715 RepID=A0A835DHT7_TETSI|nr:hypothetical protein HHK36_013923 [Tetracentron sinense]